jgi:hypothetical protein
MQAKKRGDGISVCVHGGLVRNNLVFEQLGPVFKGLNIGLEIVDGSHLTEHVIDGFQRSPDSVHRRNFFCEFFVEIFQIPRVPIDLHLNWGQVV